MLSDAIERYDDALSQWRWCHQNVQATVLFSHREQNACFTQRREKVIKCFFCLGLGKGASTTKTCDHKNNVKIYILCWAVVYSDIEIDQMDAMIYG